MTCRVERFPGTPAARRLPHGKTPVKACCSLGTPAGQAPGNPPGLQTHEHLAPARQPRLFVQGENDGFGSGEALRALVLELPPPREIVVIPGADHFFDGQLDALQGTIADWAERRPWDVAVLP